MIKILLVILTMISVSFVLFYTSDEQNPLFADSIGYFYSKGDTLYNHAIPGLVMRPEPDSKSKALISIPYGKKIVILKRMLKPQTISGINGDWAYVLYLGKKGYVFDGFISLLPTIPKKLINQFKYNLKGYLKYHSISIYREKRSTLEEENKTGTIVTSYVLSKLRPIDIYYIIRRIIIFPDLTKVELPEKNQTYQFKENKTSPITTVVYNIDRGDDLRIKKIDILISYPGGESRYVIKRIDNYQVEITLEQDIP